MLETYPLTPLQEEMLFDSLYFPDSGFDVSQVVIRLHEKLNIALLKQIWQELINRHIALRSSPHWDENKKPAFETVEGDISVIVEQDWSNKSKAEQEYEIQNYLRRDRKTGIPLRKAPLWRILVGNLSESDCVLIFTYHKILLDAKSVNLLLREMILLYNARMQSADISLPHSLPYEDYVAWLYAHKPKDEAQFWQQYLAGFSTPTVFPSSASYSAQKETTLFIAGEYTRQLSESLSARLRKLALDRGVSLETVLKAGVAILLSRYTGEEDVVFGGAFPIRPATIPGIENVAGMAVNVLPVRIHVAGEKPLSVWIEDVNTVQTNLQVYTSSSLMDVQKWAGFSKQKPLSECVFIYESASLNATLQGMENGWNVSAVQVDEQTNIPMTIYVYGDNQLSLKILYDGSRYDEGMIQRLSGHFTTLLSGMADAQVVLVGDLPVLSPTEEQQILVGWNETDAVFPDDDCLHRRFEKQVEQTPDASALFFPAMLDHPQRENLTYRELNQRANQLAHFLIKQGVTPETLIGISIDRSLDMFVALLGILKAGAAYVPIDPQYPPERVALMLEDSKAAFLISQESFRERLSAHPIEIIYVDSMRQDITQENSENPRVNLDLSNLFCVIYTSGSTGRPKGVALTHRMISNLISWQLGNTVMKQGCKTMQFASLSFDVSIHEMFSTWCSGGILMLVTELLRRDVISLLQLVIDEALDRIFLPFIALHHFAETAETYNKYPMTLLEVNTAGEQLQITPAIRSFFNRVKGCSLSNQYGPTETHVVSAYTLEGAPDTWAALPPIGKPIANSKIYLLDEYFRPVPIGVMGELYAGGTCLAREYLYRPDMTAERFIFKSVGDGPEMRLYKTGDVAVYLPDGNIQFIGRKDHQVKVRGYRIELGEIETVLGNHPAVKDAIVTTYDDKHGGKQLAAYIVFQEGKQVPIGEIKDFLKAKLPEYMLPAVYIPILKLPQTPSGKIDRRALPPASSYQPEIQQDYSAPQDEMEAFLALVWGELLNLEQVSAQDNFFDLGGNSLLSLQVAAKIRKELEIDLPVVRVFQYPTIKTLAEYLSKETKGKKLPRIPVIHAQKGESMPVEKLPTGKVPEGIAIIGMAGRFPGALSVDELMENIYNGVESTSFFRDNELDASVDQRTRSLPNYVKARNIIADVDKFDAAFFGFSPRIAEVMDPQQRVFLETAWAALESAGWDAKKYPGRIGVYAGMGYNTYLLNNVISRADLMDAVGDLQTMLGNDKDYLSTLVSYKFNLTGPALTIQTACSTSMVAICQAYYSLVTRQCDMALAGGVSITIPQESGYLYQEGSMLSKDGHTRPFDAQATGTVFGNGAGIIVLKRVEDAIRDHDHIYAVILGVGINNDGSNKVSYTAPSVEGQTAAIIMAQENAKVHPDTISYIETHGTATPLGDPIEIEALTQAFRKKTNAKQYCAIGSVKGNVGHVIAAAGVTGVIKTARQLQDKRLGPTLFYQAPNPNIDFANSPFYVNDQLVEWKSGGTPRRAAVSGFGIGGTNAHVILEEAPQLEATSASRPYQLLLLSARSDVVLDNATARLAEFLIKHGEVDLADVAFTLQTGRREFANRRAVVCRDVAEAIQMMEKPSPNRVFTRKQEGNEAPVAFMFPGQGSQYVNMGLNIYEREPLFRSLVDKCSEILKPWLNSDLRDVLYPKDGDVEKATHLLRETSFTQPALFTIEYSLARLWMSWGVRPTAMMGHSIGEFSAACLADVFSLEDALMLVARRGRMMQDLPAGAMLSVNLPAEQLEKRLNGGVSIAAVNGPSLCVASGTFEAIEALQGELEKEGIVCKKLHTSHAFHSPMMDPIVEPFAELVKKIPLSAPRIPFVSTVTADWITPQQATDPMYWARHLRAAVRFAESVTTVWQKPERVLLEVGPRNTAATLARQQAVDKKKQVSIASLGDNANDDAEWAALLGAVGNLWLSGVSLDWDAFYALETRRRIALPTYPFERKRFWAEPARQVVAQESTGFIPQKGAEMSETQAPTVQKPSRHVKIVAALTKLLEDTSGLELSGIDESATFMEMGMDSLTLTQVVAALQQKMNVKVTFRQMVEEYSTLGSLASHLEETLPADMFAEEAQAAIPAAIPAVQPVPVLSQAAPSAAGQMTPSYAAVQPTAMPVHISTVPGDAVQTIIQQQLQLMQQQLALLGGGQLPFSTALLTQNATPEASPGLPLPSVGGGAGGESTAEAAPALKKSILPERIRKSHPGTLNSTQKAALEELIARYIQRTAKSKQAAQTHRSYFADPRTVSGFSPLLKEVVYPIVVNRSSGSRLWDIDGNEYVDIINGFGSNFFGFSPPFLKEVMHAQLEQGIEIGPQTPLAGEVARMISEFVNLERVTFCNTGSEAVMGAMRLARTVTGKNKVVIFNGAYHGLFDEVIVRGTQQLRSLPAAPGVPPSAVENLLVLDYDTPEALEIIRNRADELAAILVEPVQSRHPDLQPRQFLHELRKITEQCGAALIMDEVITGFRVHPGGAQAVFDVRGDMATYGKVIGGGLPIGVIAGVPRFMDALDGGFWQFGDESIPTAGVTYFAGTFIRHPLALAAAKAALSFLKEQGGDLQKRLNEKSDHLADELNAYFQSVQAPLKVEHFGSLFKLAVDADLPYGELLYYYLRLNGIHSWDHRPFFLTIAHTDEDIRIIIQAFKKSVEEAQRAGFLPGIAHDITSTSKGKDEFPSEPPVPGARLGRDPQGNPQWFIPDPQRPGKYLSIGNKK